MSGGLATFFGEEQGGLATFFWEGLATFLGRVWLPFLGNRPQKGRQTPHPYVVLFLLM